MREYVFAGALFLVGVYCASAQTECTGEVDKFLISEEGTPAGEEIKVWNEVMERTALGPLGVPAEQINVYLLLDAINIRLKEKRSPLQIFFAEPVQANAAWTLTPLSELMEKIPSFATQLRGGDLAEKLSSMTLQEVYHQILIGGYGFKKVFRPYGLLLFNG